MSFFSVTPYGLSNKKWHLKCNFKFGHKKSNFKFIIIGLIGTECIYPTVYDKVSLFEPRGFHIQWCIPYAKCQCSNGKYYIIYKTFNNINKRHKTFFIYIIKMSDTHYLDKPL